LASPSRENLLALDRIVSRVPPRSAFEQLATAKYRSLLLLQDSIRQHGAKGAELSSINLVGSGNPFWEVAEVAHHTSQGDSRMLSIPDSVLTKKQIPLGEQMRELRLPWYWTGWTLDPSLLHMESGLSRTTVRGDYFTHFLWTDGPYPIHMTFM